MTDRYASKLANLGFELPEWCDPPSEKLVAKFEHRFSVALPDDYREFLVQHGGVTFGNAACTFQEPTPCGPRTIIDRFYGFSSQKRGDVNEKTELIEGVPSVIAIGDNTMGNMFWLKCDGKDAGHVLMHDAEGRFAWPDEMFADRYPNLAPEIRKFLDLRRQGKLPRKQKGYEHVYRLGESFTEFFDAMLPVPE